MNKSLFSFLKKIENKFGTRKFRLCIGVPVLNFIILALALDDDPEVIDLENNKNNIKGE